MFTYFFSVDVETADTSVRPGCLLTVGIVPVIWTPAAPARVFDLSESSYVRIEQTDNIDVFGYFDDDDVVNWTDTRRWWSEQSERVRAEAYEDARLIRYSEPETARAIAAYVNGVRGDNPAFFAANPVSFDKPWIDDLFTRTGVPNPFHYRSLCLRSMRFGLRAGADFGGCRDTRESEIPHHALYDAHAQALDLADMLWERDGR